MPFTTNADGYLLDPQSWTPEFCESVASELGIKLTERHWQIIQFARQFYADHDFSPAIKTLLMALRKELDPTIDSIALQQLFAHKPALYISKMAGLPKPKDCV